MKRAARILQRASALLLALCMVLLLAACNRGDDPVSKTKEDTRKPAGVAEDTDLILPYSREEGVNPFTCTSLMNEAVMPLIYDGLYTIDEHYEPSMSLVESIVVNGTTVMLTMNSERRFSDGSIITADDVVYSYELAKNSAYYAGLLSGISEVTAGGTTTVSFNLTKPNQYIAANLVFPVVKSGTADKADSVPIGSGKFVYKHHDAGGVLKKSDQHDEKFKADQIFLLNIPDEETLFNSLNIETVNAAVDDIADGDVHRIIAQNTPMPLNNLLYVGIRENGNLADAKVRQAMNAILDRKTLINSCLSGYAVSSDIPLNPDWYGLTDIKTPAAMDRTKAKDLLAEALRDQPVKIITLSGNSFREQIASELARELGSAGVACEVEALDSAVYKSAVKSGLYDLYVGEFRLPNDMDISGVLNDKQLESSWAAVQRGSSTCEAFIKGFYTQMPFLTIGFRTGVMAYSRNLKTEVTPLPGNPYANVTEWKMG